MLSKQLIDSHNLMNATNNKSNGLNSLNSTDLIRVIIYKIFDNVTNSKMITATIEFIKTKKRFVEALF